MKRGTIKIIFILISLLFLNIEAAQAGLVHKFKVYVVKEFSAWELFYTFGAIFTISALTYIIHKPAFKEEKTKIGKEKPVQGFQERKTQVKKISNILSNTLTVEQAQF